MYGQNLKAIGSHLLGDEVLKVVTGNVKTAETSLDRNLPAAYGTEVRLVRAIAQNPTGTRGKLWVISDPPEKGVGIKKNLHPMPFESHLEAGHRNRHLL